MSREVKSGGILINASSLDRNKKYKYNTTGTLVEIDGAVVVEEQNDIVLSGSKSSLRRMADIERNISVLATRYIDGTLTNEIFDTDVTFKAELNLTGTIGLDFQERIQDIIGNMVSTNTESGITVTYDDTLGKLNFSVTDSFVNATGDTMSGILNMGGNFIQNLASPLLPTDAATKVYVDSQLSGEIANVAQYTSWFFSDGTNLSEITDSSSLVINPGNNISISYNAISDEYTISSTDTNTTYTAGAGISLTGTEFSVAGGPGLVAGSTGLSHADTSSVSNLDVSGRRYVTGLTFDTFGHVTGYSTGTETVTDTNNYLTGLSLATGTLTATRSGLTDVTVDLSPLTTGLASTTYVDTAISNLVNGASAAYDTLKEIQDAMATDAELANAIANITVGDATITIAAGSGLTTGGSFTTNATSNSTITLSHADTSTATSLTASSRTYVSGLTFDTYGHVTGYTTGTETVTNTNDIDYINAASFDTATGVLTLSGVGNAGATVDLDGRYVNVTGDTMTGTLVLNNSTGPTLQATTSTGVSVILEANILQLNRPNAPFYINNEGTGGWIQIQGRNIAVDGAKLDGIEAGATADQTITAGGGLTGGGTGDVTISHADTSTAANLTASGRRYVTGLTFDTYGHVTGYTTGTETVTDTNNYVSGLSFNTANGVLTATRSGLTSLEVDLDGRYQLAGSYLTAESDTLNTVTSRGNSTSNAITVGALNVTTNAVITGNLTVSGSVTTINTEEINLADNIIVLNSNETGTPTQNAGIEVERGTDTNVSFLWDETNDTWTTGAASITAGEFIGSFQGTSTEATTANVANAWAVARTLTLNGAVTGSVAWDGSANVSMTTSLGSALDNFVQWIAQDGDGTTYTITSQDSLIFNEGGGIDINFTADDTLTFTHADTSSQISLNNSGGTVIQDVILDGYGHVTELGTVNLDARYQLAGSYLTEESDTLASVTARGSSTSVKSNFNNGIKLGYVDKYTMFNMSSTTSQIVLAAISASSVTSFKVTISASTSTGTHVTELLVVHDGTTASATEYGSVSSLTPLFGVDVDISNGDIRLLVTNTSATYTKYIADITAFLAT